MHILLVSKSFIVCNSLSELFKGFLKEVSIKIISNIEEFTNFDLEKIDLLFIDLNNNIFNQDEIIELINNKKNTKIMIMDKNKDKNLFIKSIKAGIEGYIVDIKDKNEFIFSINRVISGKKYYDLELIKNTLDMKEVDELSILTTREKEVVKLVEDGLNNKEIGELLHISAYTVKKHLSSIFTKLNLRNRREVIIYMKEN